MKRIRKLIKETLQKMMLNEGDDLMVKDFPYEKELNTVGEISYYLLWPISDKLLPTFNLTDEEMEKIRGFGNDITPDGDDYFENTGTINFYTHDFPERTHDKIVSFIKYILSEKDIIVGDIEKEAYGEKFSPERMREIGVNPDDTRVIRIPIVKNDSKTPEMPPNIHLSSGTFIKLFKDILDYDDYQGDKDAVELLMKVRQAKRGLAAKSAIPDKSYGTSQGNIHTTVKGKDYFENLLDAVEEFAQWTLDHGYRTVYIA